MIAHSLKQLTSSFLRRRFCSASLSSSFQVDDSLSDKPANSRSSWRLYRRLSAIGATGGTVSDALDGFIREGGVVGKNDLLKCVKELRKYKRYDNGFQIFEWMDKGKYKYSHRDYALRLDIICKTKGIEEAEKFFEGLSSDQKNLFTYGTLLNCYCTLKLTEKAAELLKEMEKLNYVTGVTFSNLITLALTTGQPEKVPVLVEEMKTRDLEVSPFAYGLLLQSYQQLNDMEAVERTLEEIEKEGENCHWNVYSNLAAVYIRSGNSEKAEIALKKLEKSAKTLQARDPMPYHYLISFYAGLGNSAEVKRVWKSLKSRLKTTSNSSYVLKSISNSSYLVILQALLKLGQLDELVKCYEEWRSGYKHYDPRIICLVIAGYLRQNKMEEAEKLLNDAVEKSSTAFFRGREMIIAHFLDKGEISLALEHLEAAADAVKGKDKWQPAPERIVTFRQHYEEQKDVEGAEKFFKLLKKLDSLRLESYLFLLRTYVDAGETAPDMRQRIKEDGFEITSEHEELLEKVCPQ